jgi:putative CocE/NonD family hydrolase
VATLVLLAMFGPARGQVSRTDPMANDKVSTYDWVRPQADFERREVMIPMRDGVHLYTAIVFRKGTRDAPILLTRTPYNSAAVTTRTRSQRIEDILPVADAELVDDGYIRVYQDVRGTGRSEGEYVMVRPLRGPLNKTRVDHSTDAWDTIDWLVKHVPESNGRVGITGSSYPGFTSLMGMIDPHPALKAAVPQSPMVDGWMGDDWFHNGAFRTRTFDYILIQTALRGGNGIPMGSVDEYDEILKAGSSADFARRWGIDNFPAARKMMEHPAYDAYWQAQALDKLLGQRRLSVPVMLVVGQWDQEDSYGAPAVYRALEPQDTNNDMVSLVIGPWRHSGVNYDGTTIGKLNFGHDTALEFRTRWMKPFLDCHLKSNPPPCDTPPVLTYATGTNRWETSQKWPDGAETPIYLGDKFGLSFSKPESGGANEYVSDPAQPVPMVPRPVRMDGEPWLNWLVEDQSFAEARPDVLSYKSPPLETPLHIKGAPRVELFARTTGQDADWVVKLIDVYPRENATDPGMAGYEFPIGIEIFRGRYVHGFATPTALESNHTYRFEWSLPNVDHVFLPGHRLMVQVQSSLFPLYDRNPQSWVPSIFDAKAGDYVKATQTVSWGGSEASAVYLPVAKP